jgi:hypothetical protein
VPAVVSSTSSVRILAPEDMRFHLAGKEKPARWRVGVVNLGVSL